MDAEDPEMPYVIPGPTGPQASGVTGTYLMSSFTIPTGNFRIQILQLQMTGSNRATIQGTGRLSLQN
jgi:hypothetical protein